MLSSRAYSCHISCTLSARPWYSAHTSQPPSKPAHSSCCGVDMMKIRSSTHAAPCAGSVNRAKKRATARTLWPVLEAPSGGDAGLGRGRIVRAQSVDRLVRA